MNEPVSIDNATESIADQIAADHSPENLRRCLRHIRRNSEALSEARAQMDQVLYSLLRARELAEATEETNRDLEARVYLLLGACEFDA